jgi:hypothetical protein
MQRHAFSYRPLPPGTGFEPPVLCLLTPMKRSLNAPLSRLGATSLVSRIDITASSCGLAGYAALPAGWWTWARYARAGSGPQSFRLFLAKTKIVRSSGRDCSPRWDSIPRSGAAGGRTQPAGSGIVTVKPCFAPLPVITVSKQSAARFFEAQWKSAGCLLCRPAHQGPGPDQRADLFSQMTVQIVSRR